MQSNQRCTYLTFVKHVQYVHFRKICAIVSFFKNNLKFCHMFWQSLGGKGNISCPRLTDVIETLKNNPKRSTQILWRSPWVHSTERHLITEPESGDVSYFFGCRNRLKNLCHLHRVEALRQSQNQSIEGVCLE